MRLALRLARRELRGGFKGFRIFVACLAIGVGAIAGVGSMSEAVRSGLSADARALLGGDVDLRLHNRPAEARQKAWLRQRALRVSEVVEMRAMARPADGNDTRSLVELKGVDGAYPLAGSLLLSPPLAVDAALSFRNGVWGAAADPALLAKLGIAPGARIRVGDAEFELRAAIAGEPDLVASVFRFGPRLMVALEALKATGLVRPGSQIDFRYRAELKPGSDSKAWIGDINEAFPKAGWRVRGTDQAAPGVQRFIDRMTLFLSFVGLTALLVGGIGVSNAVNSFLEGRQAAIATMKCLGATGGLVFGTYLAQILAMSLAGIAAGLVAGALAPAFGAWALAGRLPISPEAGIYPGALFLAAVFGLLTALTFALWPLGRACEIPAAALFRDRVDPAARRPRPAYRAAAAAGALALAALTIATASDRYFAGWFVGGAALTLLVLKSGAGLLMAAAKRIPAGGAEWRLALANIHRPGTTTPSVVLSLGLGLAVLVAVALVEGNLRRQIEGRLPEQAPAFFFIDIQPGQVAAFDSAVTSVPGTGDYKRVPTLRGRIVAIDGVAVEKAEISHGSAWAVHGDRALTYAAEPPAGADIVAGQWWPADYAGPPAISLDAGLARGFGLGLGDTLTLNVLGREIEARIINLREIDWRSMRFDFAIIFAPVTLEDAPHTYIAAIEAPRSIEDLVEKAISDDFPNISTIRVREALEAAVQILDGVAQAVRGTSMIAILAGALVLAGAVAAGQRKRIYDAVVFKVLGATRAAISRIYLMEFSLIGLATGAIATLIGTAIGWAVVVQLMHMKWVFLPRVAAATTLFSLALVLIAGFAGAWLALGRKAAPYLRNE